MIIPNFAIAKFARRAAAKNPEGVLSCLAGYPGFFPRTFSCMAAARPNKIWDTSLVKPDSHRIWPSDPSLACFAGRLGADFSLRRSWQEKSGIKTIAVLGSTGSIGVNTLNVISALPRDRFRIIALSADSNIGLLAEQSRALHPRIISVGKSSLAKEIKGMVPRNTRVVFGADGLREIVSRGDVSLVVFAVSGNTCLIPLIEAIRRRKLIALANKESLVSAGSIVMETARKEGVRIIPIDSEHSAIFQCLEGKQSFLRRIYLTGSGGPLLNIPKKRFDHLPQKFILKHPKWRMGRKISVDSATMMNKGLEIIEARWLFGISGDSIEVLIHPEAIIHSMVELKDGTVFAQLGIPDMRVPIQYALTYPERAGSSAPRLDFTGIEKLSFRKPDTAKFPCLRLARASLKKGGTYPAVLNASDEETVKNYLEGKVPFSAIPKVIEKVLSRHRETGGSSPTIDDILNAEGWAKEEARSLCYH